ncbi:MAG: ABC transporter ATP-binding protein [Oscillospiraceae bacterium]|jgi:branched-chain amino acid transport system ATP-binding protein|nr:ABC transporter ATP-binding protein [Oscillospiraceae bacterium]
MADNLERAASLAISDLSIHFGGLKAVDNLSFTVYEKEIFGLIGPNGAGKTTVFNCITQFYKPNAGSVKFLANTGETVELVGRPVHTIIKLGLVRTFQNVEVIKELPLIDNVLIGAHTSFKASVFEQALTLPRARREERRFREKAMNALDILGISDRANMLAGGQPYGVLKRVELARAIVSDPKLIILDEPAAGLNESETETLSHTIKLLRDQIGCTILLVEHDMGLVMGICDRICAISFGKFLACGSPSEIQKNKLVQEAYLGEQQGGDD